MLLLFDYDGVIVDSFDSLLAICAEAQLALGSGRAPSAVDFQTLETLTFDELGRAIGLPAGKRESYSEKIFAIQRKSWKPRAFPGIVTVLKELAGGHTLAVVTASQGQSVAAALGGFGLDGAITAVSGGESGAGKAQRIACLQAAHAVAGQTTYMIGDTVGDIRAGKEAGVRTAAVTWGYQQRDLLLKEAPDFLLDNPGQLLSLPGADSGGRQLA